MTTLGERYTLEAELGRGGMAVVHKALDGRHGRAVAVKVMLPAIATLHLHLGDRTAFYRWMHRAYEVRDPYALSLHGEYLWDPARADPEFSELLARVGLAASAPSA